MNSLDPNRRSTYTFLGTSDDSSDNDGEEPLPRGRVPQHSHSPLLLTATSSLPSSQGHSPGLSGPSASAFSGPGRSGSALSMPRSGSALSMRSSMRLSIDRGSISAQESLRTVPESFEMTEPEEHAEDPQRPGEVQRISLTGRGLSRPRSSTLSSGLFSQHAPSDHADDHQSGDHRRSTARYSHRGERRSTFGQSSVFVPGGWIGHHHSGPRHSQGGSVWRRGEVAHFTPAAASSSSATRISMSDPTAKLRNAQIAAAKAISILTKMEVQGYAGLEKSSVYGSAIALPQIARSVGWSQTALKHTIRSYVFLLINFILQGLLLTYIGESIQVINPNSGQMHLCDFGASVTAWAASCPEIGRSCFGPDGTPMSLERLHAFDTWNLRKFVKSSLEDLFPKLGPDIDRHIDPGEYGVENYVCRLLCCFLFTMSVVEDLRSTFMLAYLLTRLPSKEESWIMWEPPDWAPKDHVKAMHGWSELDMVQFKIAGMPRKWKFINLLVVCVPKVLLWYGTVEAGFQFLFESATITGVIINALAMTFLLQIDEMIFSRLSTESVQHIMNKLKDFPLFDLEEEEEETDDQCLERFHRQELSIGAWWEIRTWFVIIPRRLILILLAMSIFVWVYYRRNCVWNKDAGYVSKPMYLPRVSNTNLFSFLLGLLPNHEATAFWSWSDTEEEEEAE